jgi:hypothetical protein
MQSLQRKKKIPSGDCGRKAGGLEGGSPSVERKRFLKAGGLEGCNPSVERKRFLKAGGLEGCNPSVERKRFLRGTV